MITDVNSLQQRILEYGGRISYLVMNTDTMQNLRAKAIRDIDYSPSVNAGKTYETYWGIPVAICEQIKDGEVELV